MLKHVFVLGKQFAEKLDEYMRSALRKGVPPLFVNLRSLYATKEKVKYHNCFDGKPNYFD